MPKGTLEPRLQEAQHLVRELNGRVARLLAHPMLLTLDATHPYTRDLHAAVESMAAYAQAFKADLPVYRHLASLPLDERAAQQCRDRLDGAITVTLEAIEQARTLQSLLEPERPPPVVFPSAERVLN